MGKTRDTITIDDLSAVDEFHIGARKVTEDLMAQLGITAPDHVLDVGCGLGGPARFLADRFKCRVSGVDLTPDYVETANRLCQWLGLNDRVTLYQSTALTMPFKDSTFSKAYMRTRKISVLKSRGFCDGERCSRSTTSCEWRKANCCFLCRGPPQTAQAQ